MTNRIETSILVNTFTNYNYYEILIDGISLEETIFKNLNIEIKKGLVSTFLNWLSNPSERETVWKRTLPEINQTTFLPILMCGEDLDLFCDVIIAETFADNYNVYWKRFGLDIGNGENMPESIGQNVLWFENSCQLIFDKNQYYEILDKFRKYLNEENGSLCYK